MKLVLTFCVMICALSAQATSWDNQRKLAFDDVLLAPQYSEVNPNDVNTKTQLTRNISLDIPIISAAMETVTESCLAIALAEHGGIGIIHQGMSIEEQLYHIRTVKNFKTDVVKNSLHSRSSPKAGPSLRVGAAISVDEKSKARITALAKEGVDIIVIDALHGHTKVVIELIQWIKENHPTLDLIAGNVATAEGAIALAQAGADAIKVGIGPGAASPICRFAGVGVPQMSAIKAVAQALKGRNIPIIADGGVQSPGDLCKALAAGADAVMIGSLFRHTQESPADIELYKSAPHAQEGSSEEQTQLYCNNTVHDVTAHLMNGLHGCMAFIGCTTIKEMHQKAHFIRITDAAMLENY